MFSQLVCLIGPATIDSGICGLRALRTGFSWIESALVETQIDSKSESESETETDTDTDTEIEIEAETATETGSESETETERGQD